MHIQVCTAFAAALLLSACGPSGPVGQPQAARAEEAGFLDPPRIESVRRRPDGAVLLAGVAQPGAGVRLASPSGRSFSALADEAGAWSIETPPMDAATLFGLSSQKDLRAVQAEGYVAVLPTPGPAAVLLRAGGGAVGFGPVAGGLAIDAVDLDDAGAVVASGRAAPRAALTVTVDDVAAGTGSASDGGRYQLALTAPMTASAHRLRVAGAGGAIAADLSVTRPKRPPSGPYQVERLANAWRIDWVTPGGGLQTTLLFDRLGGGA